MEYFLCIINIILVGFIVYNVYNYTIIREGLEGCPASAAEQEGDRSRRASRQEIDETIKNLNASIGAIAVQQNNLSIAISSQEDKLKEVSKAATEKAKKNKEKLDKVNNK